MFLENNKIKILHSCIICITGFLRFTPSAKISLFFVFVSDKLTHQYDTRANLQRRMDHMEQENRELKEEVTRLTSLMESLIAAQSQATPTPATPRQRTVISEVVSMLVHVIHVSQLAQDMSAGFPWGMPSNFMPEGYAPTAAPMPVSRPVMSTPSPIVHVLPRVEETIYHSESFEGPDVYEKWMK